jgi:diadenosine tetraphosphate (Ap4A) HIT family hydrolase
MSDECVICLKHHGGGPLAGELIGRTGGFRIYHAMADDEGNARLGWLFIEIERHVPYLADLSDAEASTLGTLRTRLARALRHELGAEFVLSFVIGLGVAHFHEHVVPRMQGTSSDVAWYDSDEVLPQADATEVADLARRLRATLGLQEA